MTKARRALSVATGLALLLVSRSAGALDTVWPNDANAATHRLKNLGPPAAANDALRLSDVAVGACTLAASGVNGTIGCAGSLGSIATVSPPLSLSGSVLSLLMDGTSVGNVGGNLARLALTGAITAASGSGTTAFGSAGALSVLANATNGSAVPAFLGPGTAGQFLGVNGGGTALQWGSVPATSLSGTLQAGQFPALTGAVVTTAGSLATTFGTAAGLSVLGVTGSSSGVPAFFSSSANNQVLQELGGVLQFHTLDFSQVTGTPPAITSLTGPITGTGPGATATTITANAVTLANLQQLAGLSVPGVSGSSTANMAAITASANNQVLQELAGVLQFHALDFSQLTGTPPAITSLTGDVTGTGPGATATTISANAVTFAKFQQVVGRSVVGVAGGSTANTAAITSSSSGDALWNNAGTLVFAPYPYASLSGAPVTTGTPNTLAYFNGGGALASVTLPNGLHLATGTLTNDLTTGVSGGQNAVGGTVAGDGLTLLPNSLSPTLSNAGQIWIGSSHRSYFTPDITNSFGTQLILNNFVNLYGGVSTTGANAGLNIGSASGPPSTSPINVSISGNAGRVVSMVNTSTGTGAYAGIQVGNAVAGNTGNVIIFGTGYTSAFPLQTAGNVVISSSGTGTGSSGPDLTLIGGSNANSGDLNFGTADLLRWRILHAGVLQAVEQSAPATPASGFGSVWFDSTWHDLWAKNSSGGVSHTVKTLPTVSHNFVTAIDDDGTVHAAQPVEGDVVNLTTDLAGKVPTSRTLTMTAPMTCDAGSSCDWSANRTIAVSTFGTSAAGIVPASGGGTGNFLRADGTWAAPAGGVGAPGSNGIMVWNGSAAVGRTLTNSDGTVSFTNANGVSGNPVISVGTVPAASISGLAAIATSGSASDLVAGTVPAARLGSFANNEVMYWSSGLAQSTNFQFDGTALSFGAHATGTQPSLETTDTLAGFSQALFYPSTGTNVGMALSVSPRGAGFSSTNLAQFSVFNSDFQASPTNYEVITTRATGTGGFFIASGAGGTGANRPIMLAAGYATNLSTNANQLLLNTNGTVTMSSLTNGLVKTTTGTFANASSADISAALGTGSSTGILEATSGTYGTVTVDSSLSYSGTTLALPSLITPATYGGGGAYILSETVDAKGRATAVVTTTSPLASSLTWQMNQSGLSFTSNKSYLIMPASGGSAITVGASPGTAVTTTLSANYGNASTSPPTWSASAAYQSGVCFIDVGNVSGSGSGAATINFQLYDVVTDPSVSSNWTSIGNVAWIVTPTSHSFQTLGFTISGVVPAVSSLSLVISRTDSNSSQTITSLSMQAACTFGQ